MRSGQGVRGTAPHFVVLDEMAHTERLVREAHACDRVLAESRALASAMDRPATCSDCGLDFRIDGGPEDRTHMPDGRTLCAACALLAGVPEAF